MKHIHLKQEDCAWLVGKSILRRDDILQVADFYHPPRIKADIITKFVKKTGFEPGDSISCYLDQIIQLTPYEWNVFCKVLAFRWMLSGVQSEYAGEVEYLDYFRINHFYEKRLGISLWLTDLFPIYTPYPNLMEIELEKEGMSYEEHAEYLGAIGEFRLYAQREYDELGRAGLISAVFKWREMQHSNIVADVDATLARACSSCGESRWKVRARKFGVYLKCDTRNCRGVQEVGEEMGEKCLVCYGPVYRKVGMGGKKVLMCGDYPECSYVTTL